MRCCLGARAGTPLMTSALCIPLHCQQLSQNTLPLTPSNGLTPASHCCCVSRHGDTANDTGFQQTLNTDSVTYLKHRNRTPAVLDVFSLDADCPGI